MALSACDSIQIQEGLTCSIAGKTDAGASCSYLISKETFDLDLDETIDLMEAQMERNCVPVRPGVNVCKHYPDLTASPELLPARGASIVMPAKDWANMHSVLEQACRIMGKKCTYEIRRVLQNTE